MLHLNLVHIQSNLLYLSMFSNHFHLFLSEGWAGFKIKTQQASNVNNNTHLFKNYIPDIFICKVNALSEEYLVLYIKCPTLNIFWSCKLKKKLENILQEKAISVFQLQNLAFISMLCCFFVTVCEIHNFSVHRTIYQCIVLLKICCTKKIYSCLDKFIRWMKHFAFTEQTNSN